MKKMLFPALVLLLACGACKKAEDKAKEETAADTTATVKTEPAEAAKPMDSAAVEKAWTAYMTPGEPHQRLAAEAGSWTTESTMWMGADAPPQKSTGTAEVKMVYGGKYQQGVHKGTAMGMPFEGTSTVAYNNASKKYESTWIDNMGTGMMFLTGDYDAATKAITFTGKCVDPISGGEKSIREIWTAPDDNTRKMEMFETGADGKEYKSMEMIMKRK